MGVDRHTYICPKWSKNPWFLYCISKKSFISQLWSWFFGTWLDIHRYISWFSPFIWVWLSLPGYTKRSYQYWISNVSRLNDGAMFIFCLWVYNHRSNKSFKGNSQSSQNKTFRLWFSYRMPEVLKKKMNGCLFQPEYFQKYNDLFQPVKCILG